MTKKMTSNASEILEMEFGGDSEYRQAVVNERINSMIAREIYSMRTSSNLTQKQLADLIGTKQPVISRLEDADYSGHSLTMLVKIANALHREIQLSTVPEKTVATSDCPVHEGELVAADN